MELDEKITLTTILAFLLLSVILTFTKPAKASDEKILADAIEEICFDKDSELSNQEEDCMLYYVNCTVGEGGEWDDKQLFKCLRERSNGSN